MADYLSERRKHDQTEAGLRDLEWANRQPDPVQQAVDNYILMERKARAWDALLRTRSDPILLAEMNAMVPPITPPGR